MINKQLSLFEPVQWSPKKKRYKSSEMVIKALTDFQSNIVPADDKQWSSLEKELKKQKPKAALIAYAWWPFPSEQYPSIIFKENDEYSIAWVLDQLDVWRAKGRKSMWGMTNIKWSWVSAEEMTRCIEWIDKHVADDTFQWHGIYKNALGNNWCWFNNRGIFT